MISVGEEIANRDLILNEIEKEIKNQRSLIFNQLKDIEQKRRSNQYLNTIYQDYLDCLEKAKSQNELQLLMNPVWHVHKSKVPNEKILETKKFIPLDS